MINLIGEIVGKIENKITSKYRDAKARLYLKKLKNKKHNPADKIRVGFIVQMHEVWDKEVSVYEEMKLRDNFEVFMLVVPPYDFEARVVSKNYENNYFIQHYPEAIMALDESGSVINITDLKLDYIFYQRPYDYYLPEKLQSNQLVKIVKCCYIPYAFWPFDGTVNVGYTHEFIRNVYFGFMDTEEAAVRLNRKFYKSTQAGEQRFCYMGYPSFAIYANSLNSEVNGILWTPRWTTDKVLGGSHFFKYKNDFLKLSDEMKDCKIILRPHPLAFQNYISAGLMSRTEVDEFYLELEKRNIYLDLGDSIEATFRDTLVLVTDISSMLISFFLTGKPIIYCKSNVEICDTYKKIMPGLYIAENWKDVKKYLRQIYSGNDYLFEIRKKYLNQMFNDVDGISRKIVNTMVNDYKGI